MESPEYYIQAFADHIRKENYSPQYLQRLEQTPITIWQSIAVKERIEELKKIEEKNISWYKKYFWQTVAATIIATLFCAIICGIYANLFQPKIQESPPEPKTKMQLINTSLSPLILI